MQTPFIGPSYNLESRPASVQRTINLIPVPLEPGNERAPWVLKDVPGLTQFSGLQCVTRTDTLSGILSSYSVWRGTNSPFSLSGGVMTCAEQISATANTIVRELGASNIAIDRFGCEFRMGTIRADDTAQLWVSDTIVSPGDALSLIPARDNVADPAQKPWIAWGAAETSMGLSALTPGVWYSFSASLVLDDYAFWEINDLDAPAFVAQGTAYLAGAVPLVGRYVGFNCDAPFTTGSCEYRLPTISNCQADAVYGPALDPATKGTAVTLSHENFRWNLTAPAQGAARGVTARNASEDRCFEVLLGGQADGRVMVGITQAGANMNKFPGFDNLGYGYWPNSGQKYFNNIASAYAGVTATSGDHLLVRLNAGSLSISKNGVSMGVLVSGLTGDWYPTIGSDTAAAGVRWGLYNGGDWGFFGGTPAGAESWA